MKKTKIIWISLAGIVLVLLLCFLYANRYAIFRIKQTKINNIRLVVHDKELDLYSLISHKKALLINFWKSWCAPCNKELPDINKIYSDIDTNKVQFLLLGDEEKVNYDNLQFKNNIAYLVGYSKTTFSGLNIKIYPTFCLIDENGNVLWSQQGSISSEKAFADSLKKYIQDYYSTLLRVFPTR